MSESNCPICYAALEVRDVAPCWDCGADPAELGDLAEGRHKYAEFLIFDTAIVLCDFCQVDFGSYGPDYLGRSHWVDFGKGMTFVRDVLDPRPRRTSTARVADDASRSYGFSLAFENIDPPAEGDGQPAFPCRLAVPRPTAT
jgi:hypothetical protein